MILLNFSHPIPNEQIAYIEALSGQSVEKVINIPVQFDNTAPFIPQLERLLQNLELVSLDWQTQPLLINPPALNFITALLLAELHGLAGYFLPILRTRLVPGSLPPRYEVAEVLNLQNVRDNARKERYK